MVAHRQDDDADLKDYARALATESVKFLILAQENECRCQMCQARRKMAALIAGVYSAGARATADGDSSLLDELLSITSKAAVAWVKAQGVPGHPGEAPPGETPPAGGVDPAKRGGP